MLRFQLLPLLQTNLSLSFWKLVSKDVCMFDFTPEVHLALILVRFSAWSLKEEASTCAVTLKSTKKTVWAKYWLYIMNEVLFCWSKWSCLLTSTGSRFHPKPVQCCTFSGLPPSWNKEEPSGSEPIFCMSQIKGNVNRRAGQLQQKHMNRFEGHLLYLG